MQWSITQLLKRGKTFYHVLQYGCLEDIMLREIS